MFEEILQNVRLKKPLTHCITNYITTNDCANIVLACGASPTMAEAEQEAAEIASQADGLDINIGNLNSHTVLAMHRAIAAAQPSGDSGCSRSGRRRRLDVPHGDAARLFCAVSLFRRARQRVGAACRRRCSV